MSDYRFRSTITGKLILQRQYTGLDRWSDKYYYWQDATTKDLEHYYRTLNELRRNINTAATS